MFKEAQLTPLGGVLVERRRSGTESAVVIRLPPLSRFSSRLFYFGVIEDGHVSHEGWSGSCFSNFIREEGTASMSPIRKKMTYVVDGP